MSKFKTFTAIIIALLLLGGGYLLLQYTGDDMPPSITFENTQGAYLKQSNLPVKYTAEDVTRFGTCSGSTMAFKAGSNVIYFTENTTVQKLLSDYIVPEDGLRLDLAYYSPGETGLIKGFHSFNGVVVGVRTLSEDFVIPKNRPIIVVADQVGKFCNKGGNIGSVNSFLTTDKTIPSLSGIDSGWVLIASDKSLSETITANNIGNKIDKIYTISRDLKTYTKLDSAAEFDFQQDSSIVWLKLKQPIALITEFMPIYATPYIQPTSHNPLLDEIGILPPVVVAVSATLTDDASNSEPIALGTSEVSIMKFTLKANQAVNVKSLELSGDFNRYFQVLQIKDESKEEILATKSTVVSANNMTIDFPEGKFTLPANEEVQLSVIARTIKSISGTLDVSLAGLKIYNASGTIPLTEIKASHTFKNVQLTVESVDLPNNIYIYPNGAFNYDNTNYGGTASNDAYTASLVNEFSITSDMDAELTSIEIEHVGHLYNNLLSTQWDSYIKADVTVDGLSVPSANFNEDKLTIRVTNTLGEALQIKKGTKYNIKIKVYASDLAIAGRKSHFNVTAFTVNGFQLPADASSNVLPLVGPTIEIKALPTAQ